MSKNPAPGMWAASNSFPASRARCGRYQVASTILSPASPRWAASQSVSTRGGIIADPPPTGRGAGSRRPQRLQRRPHLTCEQTHVSLRLLPGHAGVAEDTDVVLVAHATADVQDALVALLGSAPHLQVGEEVDDAVRPV